MGYKQLYYTSCQLGLSGYAGFQFNAVTPDTPPELMRQVEGMTSYEPPRTLGHSPTPSEVASCPVNLCYTTDPRPVLANVSFVGADYSGRVGNYFAHAVSEGAWSEPALPIEYWKAPFWVSRESPSRDLPELAALRTGPLTRKAVDAFLDRSGALGLLPALLTCVERTVLSDDRPVVILDTDAERVAYWIAAASYLLPPALARRMSFTTYQFRPAHSRQHVTGTVPGTDFSADSTTFNSYFLFDFTSGRISEVQVEPLAELLTAIQTVQAEEVWQRARALAAGDERRISQWHPVVAAAAIMGGIGASPADLDSVTAWLAASGARLGKATVVEIGRAVLAQAGTTGVTHLSRLADIAATMNAADLLDACETRLVQLQLDGADVPARPLRTAAARRHAAGGYARRLPQLRGIALAEALNLVRAQGVPLSQALADDRVTRAAAEALLDAPQAPTWRTALTAWPELLPGILSCFAQAVTSSPDLTDRVLAVLSGALDGTLSDRDLAEWPALHRVVLIAKARQGGAHERAEMLKKLVAAKEPFNERLLLMLWPEGSWELTDALEVLQRLPRTGTHDEAPGHWVGRLLDGPLPDSDAEVEQFAKLCDQVTLRPELAGLTKAQKNLARTIAGVVTTEQGFEKARGDERRRGKLSELFDQYSSTTANGMVAAYLEARVPRMLLQLSPELQARLLSSCPDGLMNCYLREVERRIRPSDELDVPVAMTVYATWYELRADRKKRQAARLDELLVRNLPKWRRRDLNDLSRSLGKNSRIELDFRRWRDQHCRRGLLPGWLTGN